MIVVLLLLVLPASVRAAGLPLADAVARGDLAAVRTLLARGADVNAAQVDGTTALHVAVDADRLDLADALLHAGAHASRADRYGVTPIYLASLNGNDDDPPPARRRRRSQQRRSNRRDGADDGGADG